MRRMLTLTHDTALPSDRVVKIDREVLAGMLDFEFLIGLLGCLRLEVDLERIIAFPFDDEGMMDRIRDVVQSDRISCADSHVTPPLLLTNGICLTLDYSLPLASRRTLTCVKIDALDRTQSGARRESGLQSPHKSFRSSSTYAST